MTESRPWEAEVIVLPKEGVNDPEGEAILGGLHSLGYSGVGRVTAGKLLRLNIDAPDAESAKNSVARMCEQLLTNPVIEDYQIVLRPANGVDQGS
jgi:phosphoribosylformylglycinamidine synthase PurS subunit